MSDVRVDSSYDPYRALALAIVEQAVKDLRSVLKKLVKADNKLAMYEGLMSQREEAGTDQGLPLATLRREVTKAREHRTQMLFELRKLEEFFWSDWYALLSDLDGPALLEEIEAEYGYGYGAKR